MTRLTKKKIDIGALVRSVSHKKAGAIVVFLGVVREDIKNKKKVIGCNYEAYFPMALKELKKLEFEMKKKFKPQKIYLVHRTGRMRVGEISVAIVVSSKHRKEGFECCRYGIEQIKKLVPIWKEEIWDKRE